MADGGGRDGDAGSPLFDEFFDVEETVIAGGFEVFGELGGGEAGWAESFGADGPDGGDPGEVGAGAPLVGEVEPLTGTYGVFDLLAGLKGEERRVADEDGGVG